MESYQWDRSLCGVGREWILALLAAALAPLGATAQNLLQNPGFESGPTGYLTDYHYTLPVCCQVLNAGDYTVIDNPRTWNAGLAQASDHTPSGTKMLVVDGVAGIKCWQQTVSNLQPNTNYGFRFWWLYLDPAHQTPPNLSVQFLSGSTWQTAFSVQLPATVDGIWRSSQFAFNSQSTTSLTIRIIDNTAAQNGNDFALDDLELSLCAAPAVDPIRVLTQYLLALGWTNVNMTVQASGSLLSYQWRRNGVPLVDGTIPSSSTISGATTSSLLIRGAQWTDSGVYDCVVSSPCGSTVSNWRYVSVR